jgi:hypothetical protein
MRGARRFEVGADRYAAGKLYCPNEAIMQCSPKEERIGLVRNIPRAGELARRISAEAMARPYRWVGRTSSWVTPEPQRNGLDRERFP